MGGKPQKFTVLANFAWQVETVLSHPARISKVSPASTGNAARCQSSFRAPGTAIVGRPG
jgi:hypothetical protein